MKVTINRIEFDVPPNTTILEAAKSAQIDIPHLCYHPDQSIKANCRVCMVEIKGSRRPAPACATYVWDGMEVETNTKSIREMRKTVLELILANHDQSCLTCARNGSCELQALCRQFQLTTTPPAAVDAIPVQNTNPALVRDPGKCVKCNRCVEACRNQHTNVLNWSGRSTHYAITTPYNLPLEQTPCVFCGQCAAVCPVGAIVERDDIMTVRGALQDPTKHVVVQVAPAVRVALGDEFGMAPGTAVTGKTITALRRIGFDKVFDTNFAADLTIMEEGAELLDRLTNGGTLPMITSCSPGWINYIEHNHADLLGHLSTCKSPQQMFGAAVKSYYAEKTGIAPEDIFTVSVMPCTAKKYERGRPEMKVNNQYEVDCVLTTRELARMIQSDISGFTNLPDGQFDSPFGLGSGAGAIFGATGGVMEAALRTVHALLTEKPLDVLAVTAFTAVRGLDGIKEATVESNGRVIKVAVANGLANAEKLLTQIHDGTCPYQFIEIMACPGGCIGGGGQPRTAGSKPSRADALYAIDQSLPVRQSHQNPDVTAFYEQYLGKPNSEKAHALLHTHYHARQAYDLTGV